MDLILNLRDRFVDPDKTPYIFSGSTIAAREPVSCCKSVRSVIKELTEQKGLQLERPDDVAAGTVRKLFCTTVNYLELSNQDTQDLIDAIGHSITTHNKEYLRQMKARLIGKVGRWFTLFQNAFEEEEKGKNLRFCV